MKKRILSILLMCCMVLTLLPVQALAEDSAYTVGEDTGVSARALARTAGTKLKADNIATYVANGLGSGVYTLAEDVTISGTLRVTGEATVDLNGYVLRYAEEAEPGSIFRVTGGKTLTMTDSRPAATHEDAKLPAGGLITGGEGYRRDYGAGQSYSYYGGGVYVEAGASFVLAGGTIYACGVQSGAFQAFGGGIYAEGGSVTMTGGAIRNCVVSANNGANGGGVYIYSGASLTWRAASSPAALPWAAAASLHPGVPSGSPAAASRTARQADAAAACLSAATQTRYLFWTLRSPAARRKTAAAWL